MGFLVLQRPVLFCVVIILKIHGFKAFMDQIHIILPDPAGPCGTLKISHALGSIASNPYRSCIIMSESAEPAVFGLIRRTCLSGAGHPVVQRQSPACSPAFFKNAFKHTDHFSGGVNVINLGGRAVVGIDRISFVVVNPADAGRNTEFAVIKNRTVS